MPFAKARTPAGPHGRRSSWRAFGIGLIALSVAVPTVIGGQLEAANAASGQIRGHVFIDYDNDGVFDSGNTPQSGVANDKELAGVTVNAYNAANTLVGTATTAATGNPNYTITLSGVTDGDPLRLEFIPPAGNFDSFYGTNSTTSVRFVQAGAENVDLGITRPDFYNSNDPYVATVLQRSGLPGRTGNASAPAVVLNRWSVANNAPTSGPLGFDDSARKTVALIPQVGSVYSVVYDPVGRDLYVAATYKRGAGLGGLGIGGIYRINDVLDANGNLTPGVPTITNWANVADPGGLNINVGTALSNNARGLNATDGYFADPDGFAKATKIGIGGMVIDPDSRILYFVNLNDKKIYGITLATTPALVGSWNTPAVGVTPIQRAFALNIKDGALYVGYSDTGEAFPFCPASNPGGTYTGGENGSCTSTSQPSMKAYVARATIDNAGAPGAWATVLTVPLDYAKGNEIYDWQAAGASIANNHRQVLRWNTWTDWWSGYNAPDPPNPPNARSVGFVTNGGWGDDYYIHIYPQPFVASISLDSNGFMTIGLGDRTATQSGNRQAAANSGEPDGTSNNPTTFESIASGDTLLAALNTNGTYSLESNGTATGSASGSRVAQPGRSYQPAGAEGPGGIDFYYDRQALGTKTTHREATLGATAALQGVNQVMSTMIDPLDPIRVGGLAWFDSLDGDIIRGYQHETDEDHGSLKNGFQKGGGIGGVTLLLRDAPIEIGNRVWYDADMDGIQDADEAAINGAPVQLWTADGSGNPVTQIASTTTSTVNGQAGTWYFRTEGASGGTTGFVKNANYVVVFPSGSGTVNLIWPAGMSTPPGFTGLTWAQMQRTATSASGSTILNDSNPNPTNGRAPVTVGGGSESNHTIDAGWFGMSTFRIEKAIVGTPPTGKTYTFNITAATNFRGDNRLGSGGPDTPPIVDTISYTLNPGQTITSTEQIPYGYKLTFEEAGITGASVAFSPPLGGDDDHGFLVITPTLTPGGVKVTATNSYGSVDLTKILADGASLPPGTKFPIEYQIGSDPVVTTEIEAGVANTLHITGVPLGTTVKVRETLSTPATLGGYVWVAPTWDQAGTSLTPDLDGWVTVTVAVATPPIELNLTNHPMDVPVLPLAGGIGEYIFTIAGGIVIFFGAGLGVWHFFVASRRRRRPAAHRA
ncbi:MAG: hypothetical protein KF844_07815 [Cryobacterium sp.]|nr:hypothetical protein [Cryobacterium sp.]